MRASRRMVESLRDGDEPIKIMGIELTKGFYDSVVGLVSSAGLLLLSSIIDWI